MDTLVIRSATPADIPAILSLAVASGLFPPDGTDEVAGVLRGSLTGELGPNHCWVVDDDNDGLAGVGYFAPERLTEGTWNLHMIAVRPDRQRSGRGAGIVTHVEQAVTARGGRLLLVETSGVESFEPTRAFYRRCGFEQEAVIREFYNAGEDKVVFRKKLG